MAPALDDVVDIKQDLHKTSRHGLTPYGCRTKCTSPLIGDPLNFAANSGTRVLTGLYYSRPDMTTEKIEAIRDATDSCLTTGISWIVSFKAKFIQHQAPVLEGFDDTLPVPSEEQKVIDVPEAYNAPPVQTLIKLPEKNIAQQRRQRTTLRYANVMNREVFEVFAKLRHVCQLSFRRPPQEIEKQSVLNEGRYELMDSLPRNAGKKVSNV
jgi:hypothetical protein